MTREQLLRQLEQTAEAKSGTLNGPEELAALPGWDSLTQLTFIVQVERATGVRADAARVAGCRTVDDLLALFPQRP